MMPGKKAMVAMSGGVDSSVAALLAQRMGYDCIGVTMKLFEYENADADGTGQSSCVQSDAADAVRIAAQLGIPHYTFDYTDAFRQDVIERFVSSYEAGMTPNPCIDCNTFLKFGKLYEQARSMGIDTVVTGHYAQIGFDVSGEYRLMRAADPDKDQSYFLYTLTQDELSRTIFPLGALTKAETRALAEEAGFVTAKKRESQDICFVPGGDYVRFIQEYRGAPAPQGNFVDTQGNILGKHAGIVRYTIGQRKGLGLAMGRPVFVKEIRPETNEVVLAGEDEVFVSEIKIRDVHMTKALSGILAGAAAEGSPGGACRTQVMIRYNANPAWATLKTSESGDLYAIFDEPVRAPAKGQAAVFYDGDYVLGGGRIDSFGCND